METANKNTIIMPEAWRGIIDNPPKNVVIALAVKKGEIKHHELLLKFADDFNKSGNGKVLYVTNGVNGNIFFGEALKKIKNFPNGLFFNQKIKDLNGNFITEIYDIKCNRMSMSKFSLVIINQCRYSKVTVDDIEKLKKLYPKTAFIVVVEAETREELSQKEITYLADIVIEFKDEVATTEYKNRYGTVGEKFNITEYTEQS